MENEIYIHVEGMTGRDSEEKITREIARMPGVELVQVNARKGAVSVTGGDLDQLQVIDIIEALGYTALQ